MYFGGGQGGPLLPCPGWIGLPHLTHLRCVPCGIWAPAEPLAFSPLPHASHDFMRALGQGTLGQKSNDAANQPDAEATAVCLLSSCSVAARPLFFGVGG